ncbi:MAG: TonB-dependent receptor [Tannerellaceae bacterium]|nr:TonB-dependent receptor [Tannerellaceae bacterium]
MNKLRLISILILFVRCTALLSQDKLFDFTGTVVDNDTRKPIEACLVAIPDRQLWAITDEAGRFSIPKLRAGVYNYEVSYIGYRRYQGVITVNETATAGSWDIVIRLEEQSLALDEVTVTAKETKLRSASVIDRTAIQHIQAKSVEDMLQLVPGGLTKNPNLATAGQAYVREISVNANNAMGTTVLVDGAPLSNDANIQVLSTARSGIRLSENESSAGLYQSTAGRGYDLRTLSPDNVESVEVIRGIAGVEYGNLTSGAMIIKTKSGATPLEIKAKTDEFSKMFYGGKGFSLGRNAGAVNLSVDYTQSYTDTRRKYEGYERITANAGYSNVFMKSSRPLTFNLRVAYFRNINSRKSDPQLRTEERIDNKNQGVRFTLEGNWRLNTTLVSNLDYSFMVSRSHQMDYEKRFTVLHTGITPIAESTVDGEFESRYLNASYYSERTVDGKPLNVFAQIKLNKLIPLGENAFINLKIGGDWKQDSNDGDGLVFDPLHPPVINSVQTIRPRSYKSIPALSIGSVFMENKTQLPIGRTQLTLQGGVRLSNLFVDPGAGMRDVSKLEPRVNAEYRLLDKSDNRLFDNLSLVGGFGISAKMPSLLYLYPDKAYFDESSLTYLKSDLSKGLAVMTTRIINDTSNPGLKASVNNKYEAGIAAAIRKITGNVTFFYEHVRDEFGFANVPVIVPYYSYSIPAPGAGESRIDNFFYRDGAVYYTQGGTEHPASRALMHNIRSYSSPSNRNETFKKGIEYTVNLGQIPALKTSVVVDGAWLHIRYKSNEPSCQDVVTTLGTDYPYMPLMPAGSGSVNSRFNTNFRFITHIPNLKMIFSTTAQVVWSETSQNAYEDAAGNPAYYMAVDPQNGNGEIKAHVNPIGFIDKNGNYNPWKDEYYDIFQYRRMVTIFTHNNYFGKERYPVTTILNFKLTKEFSRILDFSFIANNFLSIAGKHKRTTASGYANLTIPLYFGAEITVKL